MTDPELTPAEAQARFRRTLVQVLVVQLVALAMLGLLQLRYTL